MKKIDIEQNMATDFEAKEKKIFIFKKMLS